MDSRVGASATTITTTTTTNNNNDNDNDDNNDNDNNDNTTINTNTNTNTEHNNPRLDPGLGASLAVETRSAAPDPGILLAAEAESRVL